MSGIYGSSSEEFRLRQLDGLRAKCRGSLKAVFQRAELILHENRVACLSDIRSRDDTQRCIWIFIAVPADITLTLEFVSGRQKVKRSQPYVGLKIEGVNASLENAGVVEQRLESNSSWPVTELPVGVDPVVTCTVAECLVDPLVEDHGDRQEIRVAPVIRVAHVRHVVGGYSISRDQPVLNSLLLFERERNRIDNATHWRWYKSW